MAVSRKKIRIIIEASAQKVLTVDDMSRVRDDLLAFIQDYMDPNDISVEVVRV